VTSAMKLLRRKTVAFANSSVVSIERTCRIGSEQRGAMCIPHGINCGVKFNRVAARIDTIIENCRQQLTQELQSLRDKPERKDQDGARSAAPPSSLCRSADYIPEGGRMLSAGKAVKVSIYLSEGSTHHGVPTYSSILDFSFIEGLRRNRPEGDSRVRRGSSHAFRQLC
jgi:hypothetical protein